MNIKTKFNIGDKVWMPHNYTHECPCCQLRHVNTTIIRSTEVTSIVINILEDSNDVSYDFLREYSRAENKLFASKKEATEALKLPPEEPPLELCENCLAYSKLHTKESE